MSPGRRPDDGPPDDDLRLVDLRLDYLRLDYLRLDRLSADDPGDPASGEIVDGIMSAHTPATITLRQEEQREVVISRENIRRMYVSNVSMMPDGLEKQVSVQQMADLLAFLKGVR